MRRLLLFLAFACWADWSAAQSIGGGFIQYYPPAGGSGAWDGGSVTNPGKAPTGCTNPGWSFTADDSAGACLEAANEVRLVAGPQNAEGGYFRAAWGVGTLAQMVYLDGSGNATGVSVSDNAITMQADSTAIGTLTATRMPVGIRSGTAAPSATDCDAAGEAIPPTLYLQTGDAASVNLQLFRCTQTGAATYAWQPAGHYAGTACPATCTAAAGGLCYDTDDDLLKSCTADNTWTTISGGSGTVDTFGTPVASDIAQFTDADTIEGRSYSEHATDMETALEGVLDLDQIQGQVSDTQIADGAVDGGLGGEIADGSITADDLGADSVSASELNATGVETELEAVLDLDQLQGQIGDAQIADGAVDGGTGGEIADNSVNASDIDETADYSFTTLSGKQDRNNSAVNDDDCTGEQGLWWYDTTDSAFEFCNANSGAPATLGSGSGYATVDDEDTPLTQRTTLNFEGAGVTCADDTDQTTCTIPGGGSSLPVADTTSIAEGSADNTKEVRLEVDGITTGTVRVMTVPNADGTIQYTPTAGTGISISGSNGSYTFATDSAVVNHFTTGTGSPPGTCTAGKDIYVETDQLRACICSATDTWSCTGKLRAHATDCTALTDGLADEMCFERDANTLYVCEPSAGGCDTAGEWTAVGGGSGAPTDAKYIVAEANGSLSAEVAPSAADQVPVSDSTTAATWRTLPDCDDSAGNHLNYDTGTNAFSCGTTSSATSYSTKALTESAATSVTQVSVASGAATGGELKFTVVATDNTDHQSVSGRITFACANKAGTESCTISASDTTLTTSGTLVCSYSVSTSPANAIDLQFNCVSSLTQTALNAYHLTTLVGPGTVTPQ